MNTYWIFVAYNHCSILLYYVLGKHICPSLLFFLWFLRAFLCYFLLKSLLSRLGQRAFNNTLFWIASPVSGTNGEVRTLIFLEHNRYGGMTFFFALMKESKRRHTLAWEDPSRIYLLCMEIWAWANVAPFLVPLIT